MSDFFSSDTWLIISVAIVGPAVGMWLRGLIVGKQKKPVNLIVICPHCHAEIGLEKVRNYICAACHGTEAFFDSRDGTNPKKELLFKCSECGTDNFKGFKFCPECNHEHLLL